MSKNENRTKEEILKEMKNKQENARKRVIITEQFYPALMDATVSVDEAKALVHVLATLIMQDALNTMKTTKFGDILESIHKSVVTDGERSEEVRRLLEIFKEENLFTAREIIEGMTRAIDTMITEDMRERKLDTLKPDWDRYLN